MPAITAYSMAVGINSTKASVAVSASPAQKACTRVISTPSDGGDLPPEGCSARRGRKDVRGGSGARLASELHRDVLGIALVPHAEAPLAAHVARVLPGRDGEDVDLHVRVVELGRHDHRLRAGGVAVLLEDVRPPHLLPLVGGDAAVEGHDPDVGLGHLEGEVEGLARQGGGVYL